MTHYVTQMRDRIGTHANHMHEHPRTRPARGSPNLRIETPLEVAVMLLMISNAAGARTAPAPSAQRAATPAPRTTACVTFPPLSMPVALHDISRSIRSPFDLAREIYHRIEGDGCNPPESPTEEGILGAADLGVSLLENALLGPEASVVKDTVASGLDFIADEMEGTPPRSALQNLLLSLVGLKPGRFDPPEVKPPPLAQLPSFSPEATSLPIFGRAAQAITRRPALDPTRVKIGAVNHEGVYPYRDTVSGREGRAVQVNGEYFRLHAFTSDGAVVEGVPLVLHDGRYRLRVGDPAEQGGIAQVRCRRMPGVSCSADSHYSTELTALMRAHHARGIGFTAARRRGIVHDPHRPGWYVSNGRNGLRQYLKFNGRYFPVKTHLLGGCTRLTLHTAGRAGGAAALVDVAQSPAGAGPRVITQGEYNVQFRGFASADASHVYEHAVRNAPQVRLTQEERSAILRYYGSEEADLDAYLVQDPAQPLYRRQELGIHATTLRRALSRVPGFAGRVYRGAMVPEAVLGDLEVGQTVRIPGFVRASGERGMGLQQLEGRDVPVGQAPVLLELQMQNSAHAVPLINLRDEAEVIVDSGRVFIVAETSPGRLVLREAGLARQAFGQGGATNLPLS